MVSFAGCYAKDKEFEKPSEPSEPYVPKIKNIILMIGDGFGPNHLANAKKYFNVNKFAFEDYYVCDVTTYSKDNKVTDSAAAATALATGQKVNNGEVGRHQYNDLENIMEIASKAGKKTGIITSDSICGATPASFSAHANHRYDTQEIVEDQSESNIDIFVGAYADIYRENMNSFTRNGYLCETNNTAILNQLDQSQKYLLQYTDLLAEFNHNIIHCLYILCNWLHSCGQGILHRQLPRAKALQLVAFELRASLRFGQLIKKETFTVLKIQ